MRYIKNGAGWPTCTPIIRADCTVLPDGSVGLYEIEERPGGIGIASKESPHFSDRLSELRKKWNLPEVRSLVADGHGSDDRLWLPTTTYEQALQNDGLLLVRSNPRNPAHAKFNQFAYRAISTVKNKGDKTYLPELDPESIILGLETENDLGILENLPLGDGWVAKLGQSARTYGIRIVKRGDDQHFTKLKKEIRSNIRRGIVTILQPYQPPIRTEIEGKEYDLIIRYYLGFNPTTGRYESMGGMFAAVPVGAPKSEIIHGRQDAIAGTAI